MTNACRTYTANLILQNFSKSSGYVHVVKMRYSFDGTLQALPFSGSFPVGPDSAHVLLDTVRFRATVPRVLWEIREHFYSAVHRLKSFQTVS